MVKTADYPRSRALPGRRVAWLHIPKSGTSLAVTLAHYLNPSLPANTSLLACCTRTPRLMQEVGFAQTYALPWRQNAIWEKRGNWGGHDAVRDAVSAAPCVLAAYLRRVLPRDASAL